MHPDFWHQRWHDNNIGFHSDTTSPMLEQHWNAAGVPEGARVFVPLAGKSRDMTWLASRGHGVLGIELSQLAVDQFFAEQQLMPSVHASRYGRHHIAGDIELICGDAFALDAEILSTCTGVFDRAALIALPPDMRSRYARELYAHLPAGCRGLLITIEYPAHEKQGPPFEVPEADVRDLYARDWDVDLLERRDILASQPRFADEGVTALATVAYALHRHGVRPGVA